MSYKHTGMLLFGWQDLTVTEVISCCADQQLNKCTQGRGIVHKSEECFPELCFVEVPHHSIVHCFFQVRNWESMGKMLAVLHIPKRLCKT